MRRFWINGFDRNSSEFGQAPGAYFASCTDFGLPAYLLLNRSGYDKGWDPQTEEDFMKFHQTACFVWYSGGWNQGTWSGIGNTIFSQLWPTQSREKTPWMYPYLTRLQHAEKVSDSHFYSCLYACKVPNYSTLCMYVRCGEISSTSRLQWRTQMATT